MTPITKKEYEDNREYKNTYISVPPFYFIEIAINENKDTIYVEETDFYTKKKKYHKFKQQQENGINIFIEDLYSLYKNNDKRLTIRDNYSIEVAHHSSITNNKTFHIKIENDIDFFIENEIAIALFSLLNYPN